jgi:hypothetical protein
MIDRIPRRLRLAFSRPEAPAEESAAPDAPVETAPSAEVDFVAYGEDCILSGRTVLDGDRLTDMLNGHDEYALIGVTVERFDGGSPMQVDELVVGRDELWMVHASGPRGDAARRHRTSLQYVAMKMGPYKVRGFYHATPGTDPVTAIRRRKVMVPITDVRIEYMIHGGTREDRVDAVIVNRELIEWIETIEPDRAAFPDHVKRTAKAQAQPKRLATNRY